MEFRLNNSLPIESRHNFIEKILMVMSGVESADCTVEGENIVAVDVILAAESSVSQLNYDEVKTIIDRVASEFSWVNKKVTYSVLFESQGNINTNRNPHTELLERREIVETSPGSFVYQGDFLKLMNALDDSVKKEFNSWGCENQAYPVLIETAPLYDLNYFETMAHHLYFPVSLKGSYSAIELFASQNSKAKNTKRELSLPSETIEQPQSILSPTVCYHCFSALKGYAISSQNAAFTATGKCFRNERSASTGLERLQTFNMREGIFVGSKTYIDEKFAAMLEWAKLFFDTKLDLKFRIRSANDPFFGKVGQQMQVYQTAHSLKYEIQVYLPYVDKYIACGSINNHLNSMSKAFKFTAGGDQETFSACIGIGFERLALALLSQRELSTKDLALKLADCN